MATKMELVHAITGVLEVGQHDMPPAGAVQRFPAGTMLYRRRQLYKNKEVRYYLYEDGRMAYTVEHWPAEPGERIYRSTLEALARNWTTDAAEITQPIRPVMVQAISKPRHKSGEQIKLF